MKNITRSLSALAASAVLATTVSTSASEPAHDHGAHAGNPALVRLVQDATRPYIDVNQATAAGYGRFLGCVSGPQGGAMGIHYVNGDLVGDGALDASRPEALIYEPVGDKLRLVGVEYIVLAEAWDATHTEPPTLQGQLLNYNGSPNRYGIPAFYELHVWAWQKNPNSTFADWNPLVSCDGEPVRK